MKSMLVVLTGICAVSLATAPAALAQDAKQRPAPAAAAPPPPAMAIPRAEPRPMAPPGILGRRTEAARADTPEVVRIAPRAAACLATRNRHGLHYPLPRADRTASAHRRRRRLPNTESACLRAPIVRMAPAPASWDNSGGGSGGRAKRPRAVSAARPTVDVSSRRRPLPAASGGRPNAESRRQKPALRSPYRVASARLTAATRLVEATARTRPALRRIRVWVRTGGPGITGPAAFYGYAALGLGYFDHDPFWAGYPGYGYYPYGGAYYGGGGYYGERRLLRRPRRAITGGAGAWPATALSGKLGYYGTGHLRLKVKPRDAELYVDGYFSGLVDDFDGTFQKLELEAGPHRVEVRKAGFASDDVRRRIWADESVTYRGELNRCPEGAAGRLGHRLGPIRAVARRRLPDARLNGQERLP